MKISFKEKLCSNCELLLHLSINDFKSRYASSILGIGWAYIQPLMNLVVMWYVFQVGLRNGNIDNVPFIVWFAPASLTWSFFAECTSSLTTCMKEYNYLVSKVNFNIYIVPIIKVISSCFVHAVFIFFLYFLDFVYKVPFTLYSLQVWYYFLCMIVHLIGLGWILSIVTPFWPDMQSVVGVILQVGFWVTPIVWNVNDMSPIVQTVSKLNPMYYICTGYRDSLINHVWFWERPGITLYYWGINILLIVLGSKIFSGLRSQLADVL